MTMLINTPVKRPLNTDETPKRGRTKRRCNRKRVLTPTQPKRTRPRDPNEAGRKQLVEGKANAGSLWSGESTEDRMRLVKFDEESNIQKAVPDRHSMTKETRQKLWYNRKDIKKFQLEMQAVFDEIRSKNGCKCLRLRFCPTCGPLLKEKIWTEPTVASK